ncbi:transcriptional regulator [Psychroserpens damuponensis]|uniref:transcriptional regulator n=1 Tax=Psychroserpens damuponensis TaxID=943936 RepID=UPI00059056D2|nr:tetratricopeptide repeat protein [Psychroserpens damuponensis]
MDFKYYYVALFLLLSLGTQTLWSQSAIPSSEEAYAAYKAISDSMAIEFPEDNIRTFRRESFSDAQLQTYVSLHFKRLDALQYIDGHHTFVLDSYLHSGNWFKEIGFPKECIKSYFKFFNYYQNNEASLTALEREKYIEMRSYARSLMADSYAKLGVLDSAAIQHKKNMNFTKNYDYIHKPSSINNYGLFLYWHKKELDSALYYFNLAHTITKAKFPSHTLIGSIRDNIADVNIDQHNYEKALPLYEANFDFYKNAINERSLTKDIPRLISAGAQLVTTNSVLNRVEEAQQNFNELEAIVIKQERNNTLLASSKLEYLKSKQVLLEQQHKLAAAYVTAKQIKQYSDSLHQITKAADNKWQEELNDVTMDRIALNFKLDSIQKENKIKSQKTKLWIIGLLSSIFIILLMGLILSRRQHLINANNKQLLAEQKLKMTSLEVAQLNSDIKSKERDLSDFAIKLTQDQDWAKDIANQIETIKQTASNKRDELIAELDQTITNKLNVDSDTKDFFEHLDHLNNAFYSKLTDAYPNLSKNEIRLCSLIRLKIESRNIATLQNITVASLNTSRYRLRKKLNLTENTDLDLFIQNI